MNTYIAEPLGTLYPYGTRHTEEMIRNLSLRATEYRAQVLRMVYERKSGHIGGAFSIAEILTALYFHHLRLDPKNPGRKDRDRLVFSKGHACAMLYTVLAHREYFPASELSTFRSLNTRLQGHPEPAKTPGVEVAAGPLGHGVAIGAGMALAARMDGSRRRVYVILGDGELDSGVIWEGLLLGAKYGDDATIIACGVLVARSLQAAEKLRHEGIHARVVEIHTIKPFDADLVARCAQETGAIVTAEEHTIIGGLGGAVAECLAAAHPAPMERIGLADTFAECGPYHDLLDKYGMSVEAIVEAVRRVLKRKASTRVYEDYSKEIQNA